MAFVLDDVQGTWHRRLEGSYQDATLVLFRGTTPSACGLSSARRNLLEPGDVEEGLAAAGAIGDDTLQQEGARRVRPETFTHGSSAQRVDWLHRALQAGRVDDCDTFSAR